MQLAYSKISPMPDVFISYPHEAKSDAALFANVLQAKGVSAWCAESDLPSGGEWKGKVEEALSNSGAIVFFVYPRLEPSSWMRQEYMQALESYWSGKTRILVPLLVGSKVEPPSFLRQWQSLRVENKSDWDRAASQLTQWIRSNEHVRSEPGEKEKRELSRRLDDITKQAKHIEFNSTQTGEESASGSASHKTAVRSSRTGEFRQIGTRKSRSSKASKR